MTGTVDPAIRTLGQTPLLSGLDDAKLARLLAVAQRKSVPVGTRLITKGDVAGNLYLVLRGRFTVLSGGQAIADIGAGEPIGEIAFFAGGTRSADVVAARSGEVLVLGRDAWEALSRDVPEISQAILASLAGRLADTSRSAAGLRPLAPRCIAVLGELPAPLAAAFAADMPDWTVIPPGAPKARAQLHRLEAAGRKVLVLSPDAGMLGEVDEVMIVARGAADPVAPDLVLPPGVPVRLVLWRASAEDPIRGGAAWRAACPARRHHNVALDSPGDIARLLRFLDGRALGLVLSGGGAQGTAHLGALKALSEHGLVFDMVGGTSAGAAMGAALALGRDPDAVMALLEDVFLRSKAMGRYTLPRYSVLDPSLFDAALRRHFGDRDIEDLSMPYFAVATSLTRNDMALLERGPLWAAVRASTSIPVVFPPWIAEAGEILVDGAMIDNAPIQAMRAAKPGPAVLLNMLRADDWRSGVEYADLPGRAGVVWQLLRDMLRWGQPPGQADPSFPGAVAVLSRVFNVNAQRRLRGVEAPGDVMIDIHPLEGMAFLDWTRAREQFEASHAAFSAALAVAAAAGHGPGDPVAMMDAMKRALPWNAGGAGKD